MNRIISLSFVCFAVLFALFIVHCDNTECKFNADCPSTGNTTQQCIGGRCVTPEKGDTGDAGITQDTEPSECQDGFKRKCYNGPKGSEDLGICQAGEQVCEKGKWDPCTGEVTPESEACGNGKDDNCNGLLDEGCACKKDDPPRPCYNGPKDTETHLPCQTGRQSCQSDGTWSAVCEGQVLPRKETCNGIDDDCNGQIDDDCPCKAGESRTCYVSFQSQTANIGICKEGVMTCSDKQVWGKCEGSTGPKRAETCNGEDDNCDGTVDEGCDCKPGENVECYTGPDGTLGKGICKKGRKSCNQDGTWGPCLDQIVPQPNEQCNGKDDDCNGRIDDSLTPPICGLQKGICAGAKRPCGGEKGWLPCTPSVYTQTSTKYEENESSCDNIDNDCDGQIDENLIRPCYSESKGCQQSGQSYLCEGSCQSGFQSCKTGHWGLCTGEISPSKETCNGADDDCDGIIDNGCQCSPGTQQDCYTGPAGTANKGICTKGRAVCLPSGRWGSCSGDVTPITEVCNGKDDDCNGKIDDNLTRVCYTGTSGTAGVGVCKKGISTCQNGSFSTCTNETTPSNEECDNKLDDDCDGRVDETDARALLFKGNAQHVEVPHDNKLNPTGSFTIELWYYLDSLSSLNIALLINKHKSQDNGNGFHLKLQKENTAFPQCGLSWWNADGGNQLLFGPCPIKSWAHIALVYDNGTKEYRFYLNGKAISKGIKEIKISPNQYPLLLGTESSPTADVHFQGKIASVRISNTVRYTTGFSPSCTFKSDASTTAIWNIDSGRGTTIKDSSSNKFDGTTKGPTWSLGRTCNASKHGGCK